MLPISLQELGDLLCLKNYLDYTEDGRRGFNDPHPPYGNGSLRLRLEGVVLEVRKRAEQHEADGRYKDAEYLYRRIIESSDLDVDLDVAVRTQKTVVSLYAKLGDFLAAQRAQEEIVSAMALNHSKYDNTLFCEEEIIAEMRNLVRLYTRFGSRIALDPEYDGGMSIIDRAAKTDVNLLNSGLV